MLPLPIRGAYSVAPRRRLLLCQADQALQLWQLPHCPGATSLPAPLDAQSSTDGGEQVAADEPRQLLLLKPKQPQCNLRCSALAPDGQWMARTLARLRVALRVRVRVRMARTLARVRVAVRVRVRVRMARTLALALALALTLTHVERAGPVWPAGPTLTRTLTLTLTLTPNPNPSP